MAKEFIVTALLPATPHEIYQAWLSSAGHSQMTGSTATISPDIGGEFSAWDGYIMGRNLELEKDKRILQSWRTTEFTPDEPDSHVEITLQQVGNQTKLTLHHTDLPPHGGQYEQGWVESYFDPMKDYFASLSRARR